jgi:hypothetical protein
VLSKTTKASVLLAALAEPDNAQAQLTRDLLTSSRMFLEHTLWQTSAQLNDLITSQRVFVNRPLATLYDLPFTGAAGEFIDAEFPAAELRAGILTQPAVLWALSDPEATSIVHRGIYVHNDILCLDPVPSPGDLLQQPDIQEALSMLTTEREKSDYRMNDVGCKTCHAYIDPFGLVLEAFDAVGAHRSEADGEPVDPTGEFQISGSLSGKITGARAFADALRADGLFTACATQKIASYAIGRSVRTQATCEVRELHERVTERGGSVETLFREVAVSTFMRARAGASQ